MLLFAPGRDNWPMEIHAFSILKGRSPLSCTCIMRRYYCHIGEYLISQQSGKLTQESSDLEVLNRFSLEVRPHRVIGREKEDV